MGKQITRLEAEALLEKNWKGKYAKFTYPGYQPVYGRVDSIAIGTGIKDKNMVLIKMGDKMYRCSPEAFKDCLTLINENGDTHTGGTGSPAGPPEKH